MKLEKHLFQGDTQGGVALSAKLMRKHFFVLPHPRTTLYMRFRVVPNHTHITQI
jgi:hypothetical protein